MPTFLEELIAIPQFGVAAFIDEPNKSVYLYFSNSLYTLFSTHIARLKLGIHDCKPLQDAFDDVRFEIRVLTAFESDPGSIALRTEYVRQQQLFLSAGYKDLRAGYKPIGYKLKTRVLSDYRNNYINTPLVYITGRSPCQEEIVLGIFNSIPESTEWVNSIYGDKTNDVLPEFCDNELTQGYLKANGYKLLK